MITLAAICFIVVVAIRVWSAAGRIDRNINEANEKHWDEMRKR